METGIPIKEFIRLLKQAEKAGEKKDWAQIDSINAALEKVGYRVVVRDGTTYLEQGYNGPG